MSPIIVHIIDHSVRARIASFVLHSNNCAIVFRRTIYLYNISKTDLLSNKGLLCHELTHVLQWRRYGVVRFPILYLWYSIVHGYYQNPFEVEARSKETDFSILDQFDIK